MGFIGFFFEDSVFVDVGIWVYVCFVKENSVLGEFVFEFDFGVKLVVLDCYGGFIFEYVFGWDDSLMVMDLVFRFDDYFIIIDVVDVDCFINVDG